MDVSTEIGQTAPRVFVLSESMRVRWSPDDVDEIDQEAKRLRMKTGENVTRSDVVRLGVRDYLRRTEDEDAVPA